MSNACRMKRLILVLLLLSSSLLSACAFKDIDRRLFVSVIGIDPAEKMEKGFKVTLKIAIPFGAIKESSSPTFAYLSEEGETIGEAIRILETHVDKVLEFGHMKTIVVNEELLKGELQEFMNYFVRRGDLQMIAYVAAARPSAETILRVEPDTEAPASISFFNFFGGTGTESPFIVTSYLFEFRRDYLADGIDPVLPIMETNEDQSELIVNKSIVIGKKGKMLELDPLLTKQYNSLVHNASGFSYKVKKDGMQLLLNIDHIETKYKILTDKGRPSKVVLTIKKVGVIGEANKALSPKELPHYNKISEQDLSSKVRELLLKLQEENLDPFGFGLRYRTMKLHSSKPYEVWKEAYPEIDFDVVMKINLKSTGVTE
ncbi:Ger(x)C family spore germination protein [Sporosarcina sp. Te-1]|uniref:Ger(x)C family spore germination protein n=1 Tax=Sporosarcina sp. Te-1 TaxID=2818390 RepID=UPI001A9E09E2|nr:Ger(x)C family spore germination protein [Sporosarcina sp. Te-1]QTD43045.1 Ger(x)C family spore germination protein [Sporosarcina sp. Te-1]